MSETIKKIMNLFAGAGINFTVKDNAIIVPDVDFKIFSVCDYNYIRLGAMSAHFSDAHVHNIEMMYDGRMLDILLKNGADISVIF